MTIDLYYLTLSPPCRAVQMTAAAVGVELNLKVVDLFAHEHKTPEFLALNPRHLIPVLVDNGFVLTESRAIMVYLVERYGKTDDDLYPRDLQRQALINQALMFDHFVLYENLSSYYYPRLVNTSTPINHSLEPKIEQALEVLNTVLEGKTFVTGEHFTVADISLVTTASSFFHSEGGFVLGNRYPNVSRWFNKCKLVTPRYDQYLRELMVFFAGLSK